MSPAILPEEPIAGNTKTKDGCERGLIINSGCAGFLAGICPVRAAWKGTVEKVPNERGRSKQRPYKGLSMRFS